MSEPVDAVPTSEDVALARAALLEITPAATVGEPAGSVTEEDGVLTLYFDTTLPGYVGWRWTVSLSHGAGGSVSVLETELTPGEGALLSPDWVPWSVRLADYKSAQADLAAQALEGDDDDDDDEDDDDFDDEDVHDDDEALLHSGDLDGVDIDSLDEGGEAGQSVRPTGSALPTVSDDKSKHSEGEPDDARPDPPVKARRSQRGKKQQQRDEGD